jgi:hypothetical protein
MGLMDLARSTAYMDAREPQSVLLPAGDHNAGAHLKLMGMPGMYAVNEAGTLSLTEAGNKKLAEMNADSASSTTSALAAIAKFVPTEIIGIYVAVGTIMLAWNEPANMAAWFWVCLALSVVFFTVAYLTNNAVDIRTHTFKVSGLFVWRLAATAIAYVVWALAISPAVTAQFPFMSGLRHGSDITSIAILVVSPLLAAVDGLMLQLTAPKIDKQPAT